jgi:hypothetical protein
MMSWLDTYGEVVGLKLGADLAVVLNDFQDISRFVIFLTLFSRLSFMRTFWKFQRFFVDISKKIDGK